MTYLLHNRWHKCGAVIARLCVCSATLIWSLIIITVPDALAPTSYGSLITAILPENVYGYILGSIAAVQLYRLLRQSSPHWLGTIGYAIMLGAWLFVEAIMLFVARPIQPTSASTVTITLALAIYAFVANPRSAGDTGC